MQTDEKIFTSAVKRYLVSQLNLTPMNNPSVAEAFRRWLVHLANPYPFQLVWAVGRCKFALNWMNALIIDTAHQYCCSIAVLSQSVKCVICRRWDLVAPLVWVAWSNTYQVPFLSCSLPLPPDMALGEGKEGAWQVIWRQLSINYSSDHKNSGNKRTAFKLNPELRIDHNGPVKLCIVAASFEKCLNFSVWVKGPKCDQFECFKRFASK